MIVTIKASSLDTSWCWDCAHYRCQGLVVVVVVFRRARNKGLPVLPLSMSQVLGVVSSVSHVVQMFGVS